jgi:hypothetical protein
MKDSKRIKKLGAIGKAGKSSIDPIEIFVIFYDAPIVFLNLSPAPCF